MIGVVRRLLAVYCVFLAADAWAQQPVVTDSRIKTFVYNEYDVYNIYTHYGYQSNVEFSKDEEIVTVSVGDRIGWQIVPVGRRLFIRPMEEDASTNMTVITSKRTYQFDLTSSGPGKLRPAEELAYVVRFYYPDADDRLHVSPPVSAAPFSATAYNYRYSFSGPDELAPLKVFDDGSETYFYLSTIGAMPQFFVVAPDGKEYPVVAAPSEEGVVVVNGVTSMFVLRYGGNVAIYVYNDGI